MRIALEVRRTLGLRASEAHRRFFLYRLWGRVRFRQPKGWTEPHLAIVDTGAPYSVLPASVWPTPKTQPFFEVPLRGIVPGKDSKIEAILAKVSTKFLDARHVSATLPLLAMLARTDHVPLILGWGGCLDRSKLFLDARHRTAWFEF